MVNYKLGKNSLYSASSVTGGNQEKYVRGDYFFKVNKVGLNEGLVEYLVSLVLKHSTLKEDLILDYDYCKINGKLGCRSKNFLRQDEVFLSMNTLFSKVSGSYDLASQLGVLRDERSRLSFLKSIVFSATGSEVFAESFIQNYMKPMLFLDMLVLNVDRHCRNYGLIYCTKTGKFRFPPIFDNGLSLNTLRRDFVSLSSITISGSFTSQVIPFGYPLEPPFKIFYNSLLDELDSFESSNGKMYEVTVLRNQLVSYQGLFKI